MKTQEKKYFEIGFFVGVLHIIIVQIVFNLIINKAFAEEVKQAVIEYLKLAGPPVVAILIITLIVLIYRKVKEK